MQQLQHERWRIKGDATVHLRRLAPFTDLIQYFSVPTAFIYVTVKSSALFPELKVVPAVIKPAAKRHIKAAEPPV